MAWLNDNLVNVNSPMAGGAMHVHICGMIATRKSRMWHAKGFPGT